MNPYRPFLVRLAGRRQLSPSFVRITLSGDDLAKCSPTLLDQRVKLLFGEPHQLAELLGTDEWFTDWMAKPADQRPAMRTYTLSGLRRVAGWRGEVDIDVAVHTLHDGGSPGLRFATLAPVGAEALLIAGCIERTGHDSVGLAWRPGAAKDLRLIGDETALPAIRNILSSLPSVARGRAVIEVPLAADVVSLAAPHGVQVEWRVRERGERAIGLLDQPARDDDGPLIWDEARGAATKYGWVAGEAGWVRELRAEARSIGLPKGQVSFMGYWRRGMPGA